MKILQLIQKPQPRGAETFAAQLSDNLQQLGHTSRIVAIFPSSDSTKYKSKYLSMNADPKARFWDHDGWKSLANIIAEEKPDIVQANAGDTLKYAVFSRLFYKWRQPIIFRNASTLSAYLQNPIQKLYTRFLFTKVDAVASVSEYSRQDLVKLFPFLSSKSVRVPIGLEPERITKDPFINEPKKNLNLVHVGGFSFEKNHMGLLHIFELVSKRFENVHLWLVGDGPLKNKVEASVEALGLTSRVTFTGFIDNPLDYIAHGDALLLPSIIEGLPGVILEAMLYKTPVVANEVGGIAEVVVNNKTGWLIESGQEVKFADAICELLENPEKKALIVSNAYKNVKEHYMNRDIAQSFASLYKSVNQVADAS